uniref:Integrase catalytic domain-containing protein n=1 Tax=Tanacetum cinerariifolium TaxID=118510 RepID=A0A699GNS0_TANCI|nr:hypothetical protein [Tanacetum cinerariifolium]
MKQPNPAFAKILILDTRKFEQWKFRIQQYLQNEHYALWEVIEFGDSYESPQVDSATGSASEGTTKNKGRTVVVTTEDIQKRRNDVKARTTLLLALPDEHQLRFSKYKTAQELCAAILKTFEGLETLEQTFNRLQAIVSHLKFMDVEIEQDDLNQKFLTSLAPEWLIGKEEVNTASIPTASTQVSPVSTNVAAASIKDHALVADQEALTKFALMAKSSSDNEVEASLVEFKNQEIKFCEKIKGLKFKVESKDNRIKRLTNKLEEIKKEKEGLDSKLTVLFPPPAQVYSLPNKDMSWTGLPEFADDTITNYSRTSPSIESNYSDLLNSDSSVFENGESSESIMSKPMIKLVKATDSLTDSGCSWHMTGNISYLSDYEPYDGGYVSFGQGGGKITGKGIIKTGKLEFENVYFVKDLKNKEMNDFCSRKGIKREFCNARTLKQNGVAERRNRTLTEAARTMLVDAKLPVTFCAKAVNTACYVQNMVLVNKSQNKTPYKLFNGITPAIGFLKQFGCHVMIFNTLDHLGKFDAKGDEGYFIGYSMCSKAFRVFNKRAKRVEENLHVDFLENKLIEKGDGLNWLFDIVTLTNSMNYVLVVVAGTSSTNFSGTKDAASQDVKKDVSSLRYIAFPNWFHKAHLESSTSDTNRVEADLSNMENNISASPTPTIRIHKDHPTSQIISPMDTPVQTRNMSKEMEEQSFIASIHHNTNPDLLQFCLFLCFLSQEEPKKISDALEDPKVRPIGTKWVLKNKKDERGIAIRNKARLVAQGHTQEKGIDYEEVFAPVVRIEAIRLFLAYASFMGFIVYQMDVKSAFLYGTIDEEVYVMQPPVFQDPEFPDRVYKVEKAMYGLHQAPRAWYVTLSKYLLTNGFQRGTIDQTLFIKKHKGDFLLVQVAMGELNFFLGLQVLQKKDDIFLSQDKYVGDILKKFRYSDVRSVNTLMDKENAWGKDETVKRIFRYLKGHPKMGIWYPRESLFDLVAFSDSDYGDDNVADLLTKPFDTGRFQYFVFWSTARIETTDEGTKILATVDGKLRTISESSIRINLKLNDEAGISSLPDAELFENLALMGYTILPNQKFTFQKGQFSHQWKYLIHTIMQCLSSKSTGFNELSSNIATAVGKGSSTLTEPYHIPSPESKQSPQHDLSSLIHPLVTTEIIPTVTPTDIPTLRQYSRRARIAQSLALPNAVDEPTSPLGDDSQGEAFPTVSGLKVEQDRENIIKTSTLPYDSTPRVTSLAADEGTQDLEITSLKARIKLLEDKDRGGAEPSREDAIIKGRSLETKEEAGVEKSTEKDSNDIEELVNVLTPLDAASILTSGVQAVSVPPAAEVATVSVPTGIGLVPTASLIFTTASVVTPYSRRKGKEKMVESDTPKKKKLQEQIDVQEYEQFAADLSIGERIDMINKLFKYQDHYAKRMSLEEIREKFIPVWKQIEDFLPMALKEEGVRFKRQGLRKDLNQLWNLVKETLSIRHATSDKEKELWVELKRLYEPDVKDQLDEFSLPEDFPTASEEMFPLLSQKDATAEEVCTADKDKELWSKTH